MDERPMQYPDMTVQFFPPDQDLETGSPLDGMTEIRVAVVRSEEQRRVNRYPWHLLDREKSYMLLSGVNPKVVRTKAYLYAARRGWKVTGTIVGPDSLRMMKVCDVQKSAV